MTTTVVIPTKNESIGIKEVLPKVDLNWADEWFLVDNHSTDGTIEEATKLGFKVIQQTGKGLSNAYREGVELSHSENVLFFHPDGNCKPEYIPKLIKKMDEGDYDIVQISRFGKNGISEDDTMRILGYIWKQNVRFFNKCFFWWKID